MKDKKLTEITQEMFTLMIMQANSRLLHQEQEIDNTRLTIMKTYKMTKHLEDMGFKVKYFVNKDGNLSYTYEQREQIGYNIR